MSDSRDRIETVSVAMTTYRPDERFLFEQLDSIRAQVRAADEVCICDDGSKDGTVERVRAYIAKHELCAWHVLEHESNCGVGKSFHDSIEACSGDLIFLCDQDDIWLPDKVKRFVQMFNEHAEVYCLLGNYYLVDEKSERISVSTTGDNLFFEEWDRKVAGAPLYRIPVSTILAHNNAPGATQAFSSEVRDTFLQVEGHRRMHDWRIDTVAALQFDGLYYTDEVLTLYRQHSSNTVGVRNNYLALPERSSVLGRVRWNAHMLRYVLAKSWETRREPYGRVSCFEFDNNNYADNKPKTIRKSYFALCEPSGRALKEYKAWERYIKASRRAVKQHKLRGFRSLRHRHARCYKAHFQYWRWPERLACWLKDVNWCLFGWRE